MRILSRSRILRILISMVAVTGLSVARVSADPVPVGVSLEGIPRLALVEEDLRIVFPDFTVELFNVTQLKPGFCRVCGDGACGSIFPDHGPVQRSFERRPGAGNDRREREWLPLVYRTHPDDRD
jgi:hypothetical protein